MGGGRLVLFSRRRKWRRCCPFLLSDVTLVVQVRSSVMCTPRNVVLPTLSTVKPSMVSGGWSTEFFLKSITTSFVLPTLRDRLLAPHHSASCATFFSVVRFIIVSDEAYHSCFISKLDDVVGAGLGSAVVSQQREEQRAEHTALWGTCAQCGNSRHRLPEVLQLKSPGSNYRGRC